MKWEELVLTTVKKVYAIRESVERQSRDKNAFKNVPLLGDIAYKLSGTALSKDQLKDISAFVSASCPDENTLRIMETIAAFKGKNKVKRPFKIWLSYAGLILPVLIMIGIEVYVVMTNTFMEMPYILGIFGLFIVAIALSIVLYAYLGYDPVYRRDSIENNTWKALNAECQRMLQKNARPKKQVKLLPTNKQQL